MSGVRAHLVTTALLGLLALPLSSLSAQPVITSTFSSPTALSTNALHITLRTQEGLERFVLSPKSTRMGETGETHYKGFARPRNFQRERLPVAATLTPSKGWIFFTSRRTGRPVAATVSFERATSAPRPRKTRISRVPARQLPCGSDAEEDQHRSATSHSTSSRRKNISARSLVTANGVKSFSPPRVLEVATEADVEFYRIHGDDTNTYIRAVLNAVDAIYTSTLGIRLQVINQRVTRTGPASRGTIPAIKLLEQFRASPFASSSPADVRHLFTGRSIEGLTIGIAYVGATCVYGGRYGVGLSVAVSTGLQPFLAAHEIAHNLSAAHDYEHQSIMNPAITSANNRFSSKSSTSMYDFVASSGSCLSTDSLSGVALRINSEEPSTFSAKVALTTREPKSCNVSLLGSIDGRRFIPLSTQSVDTEGTGTPASALFEATAPKLSNRQTFSFRAKVSCGTSRAESSSVKAQFGASSTTTTNTRTALRWLEALKKGLNS